MTREQSALLAKAERSIEAARLLTANGMSDFAVSRAYYAMFYAAEALLLGKDLAFSKHSAVIAAFGQHFARSGRVSVELHQHLREGQDLRNIGDYGAGEPVGAEDAAEQILRAVRFLEVVRPLVDENESASP